MTESTYRPVGKLMPDWMINCTERIMQYYIDRYLNCDPVILTGRLLRRRDTSICSTRTFRSVRRCAPTAPSTASFSRNPRPVNTL